MDRAKAIAPPNLVWIDRRIAYSKRKYHSGWIRTGVTLNIIYDKKYINKKERERHLPGYC